MGKVWTPGNGNPNANNASKIKTLARQLVHLRELVLRVSHNALAVAAAVDVLKALAVDSGAVTEEDLNARIKQRFEDAWKPRAEQASPAE